MNRHGARSRSQLGRSHFRESVGIISGTGDTVPTMAGFTPNGRRPAELRALGEVGQFVLGLVAGFSSDEIADKREWTAEQHREFEAAAAKWLAEQ